MADEKKDEPSSSKPESPSTTTTLEDARKFLNDERVRSESDEKKAEFLKSKGCSDDDIESLLKEQPASSEPAAHGESEQIQSQAEATIPNQVQTEAVPQQNISQSTASSSNDTRPIITYPEFLTQSQKPPPLLSPSRLANGATVVATGWTIAYGIARFIINPMVTTQSEARSEYYQHASGKLTILNEKLESMVSQVPSKDSRRSNSEAETDDTSSYGDPAEMFHREIGTQTSTQDLLGSGPDHDTVVKPVDKQAESLSRLNAAMKEMSDMYVKRAESTSALFSELRESREEIDKLAYPSEPLSYGGSGFGVGRSSEPDDEFKKCKDAIRSVKGMFLSARNFPPAGAAR